MKALSLNQIRIILAVFFVLAALIIPGSSPVVAVGPWHVATTGSDSNDCLSAGTPCLTINAAIGKASAGDTILVGTGTYTASASPEVVWLNKGLILSGGWNAEFTTQTGRSIIDGSSAQRGVTVAGAGGDIILSGFEIRNGYNYSYGGGISIINSNLILTDSLVKDNQTDRYGGGIFIANGSTVWIKNSSITGNTTLHEGGGIHEDGGGIYNLNSTSIIENSTISGNTASAGGGISSEGSNSHLEIYNTTIALNAAEDRGGGIYAYQGEIIMQNSILAGNSLSSVYYGHFGPDCYFGGSGVDGEGEYVFTGGYNLVEDPIDCDFIPTAGDLTSINPKLGVLQDNGGGTLTHALLSGSLARDQGDPAGCKDHLGNPLTTDQRGVARDGRCDIGAYEWQIPPPAAYQISLPYITRSCGSTYYDNFSNPGSGWPVLDYAEGRHEYLNGEYRILVKAADWWTASRTSFKLTDFVAVVDVRNVPGGSGSYGLLFGLYDDWGGFYSFEIYPSGAYTIARYNTYAGWELLAGGYTPSILAGSATNQLKIERNGKYIWAYVNDQLVNIITDSYSMGERYLGLIAVSYTQPNVDARFDNFTVYPISCGVSSSYGLAIETMVSEPETVSDLVENSSSGSHQREQP